MILEELCSNCAGNIDASCIIYNGDYLSTLNVAPMEHLNGGILSKINNTLEATAISGTPTTRPKYLGKIGIDASNNKIWIGISGKTWGTIGVPATTTSTTTIAPSTTTTTSTEEPTTTSTTSSSTSTSTSTTTQAPTTSTTTSTSSSTTTSTTSTSTSTTTTSSSTSTTSTTSTTAIPTTSTTSTAAPTTTSTTSSSSTTTSTTTGIPTTTTTTTTTTASFNRNTTITQITPSYNLFETGGDIAVSETENENDVAYRWTAYDNEGSVADTLYGKSGNLSINTPGIYDIKLEVESFNLLDRYSARALFIEEVPFSEGEADLVIDLDAIEAGTFTNPISDASLAGNGTTNVAYDFDEVSRPGFKIYLKGSFNGRFRFVGLYGTSGSPVRIQSPTSGQAVFTATNSSQPYALQMTGVQYVTIDGTASSDQQYGIKFNGYINSATSGQIIFITGNGNRGIRILGVECDGRKNDEGSSATGGGAAIQVQPPTPTSAENSTNWSLEYFDGVGNYIHDNFGEGYYIGYFSNAEQSGYRPYLTGNVRILHNIIHDTHRDGVQIASSNYCEIAYNDIRRVGQEESSDHCAAISWNDGNLTSYIYKNYVEDVDLFVSGQNGSDNTRGTDVSPANYYFYDNFAKQRSVTLISGGTVNQFNYLKTEGAVCNWHFFNNTLICPAVIYTPFTLDHTGPTYQSLNCTFAGNLCLSSGTDAANYPLVRLTLPPTDRSGWLVDDVYRRMADEAELGLDADNDYRIVSETSPAFGGGFDWASRFTGVVFPGEANRDREGYSNYVNSEYTAGCDSGYRLFIVGEWVNIPSRPELGTSAELTFTSGGNILNDSGGDTEDKIIAGEWSRVRLFSFTDRRISNKDGETTLGGEANHAIANAGTNSSNYEVNGKSPSEPIYVTNIGGVSPTSVLQGNAQSGDGLIATYRNIVGNNAGYGAFFNSGATLSGGDVNTAPTSSVNYKSLTLEFIRAFNCNTEFLYIGSTLKSAYAIHEDVIVKNCLGVNANWDLAQFNDVKNLYVSNITCINGGLADEPAQNQLFQFQNCGGICKNSIFISAPYGGNFALNDFIFRNNYVEWDGDVSLQMLSYFDNYGESARLFPDPTGKKLLIENCDFVCVNGTGGALFDIYDGEATIEIKNCRIFGKSSLYNNISGTSDPEGTRLIDGGGNTFVDNIDDIEKPTFINTSPTDFENHGKLVEITNFNKERGYRSIVEIPVPTTTTTSSSSTSTTSTTSTSTTTTTSSTSTTTSTTTQIPTTTTTTTTQLVTNKTVLVSFGSSTNPTVTGDSRTWNYANTDNPDNTYSLSNLKDSEGEEITGLSLAVVLALSDQSNLGSANAGTGDAADFPANSARDYWYPASGTRTFKVVIPEALRDRNFVFRVLSNKAASGPNNATITIDGNVHDLGDVTGEPDDVARQVVNVAAGSGDAEITIGSTDGTGLSPINAMEITWFEQDLDPFDLILSFTDASDPISNPAGGVYYNQTGSVGTTGVRVSDMVDIENNITTIDFEIIADMSQGGGEGSGLSVNTGLFGDATVDGTYFTQKANEDSAFAALAFVESLWCSFNNLPSGYTYEIMMSGYRSSGSQRTGRAKIEDTVTPSQTFSYQEWDAIGNSDFANRFVESGILPDENNKIQIRIGKTTHNDHVQWIRLKATPI